MDAAHAARAAWLAAGGPVWVGGVDGLNLVRDTESVLAAKCPTVLISSAASGTSIRVSVADMATLIADAKAGDLDHLVTP